MTGEEALAIVNGALEVAGSAPLNTLEADILSGSVRNQSYPEIAGEKGYDEGHVKNTGSALCTRLSEVFGEKVTKKNVKAVLERYAKKTSAQNPGNYDILEYRDTKDKTPRPRNRPIPSDIPRQSPTFVEYGSPDQESFLAELEQALESHREVILWGMGGVGKTELALQYAQKHKANYAAQYWLSIRDKGLAAAVVELAECSIDLPEPLKGKSLEDQAAWYWQNWLPDQGNLLVILDDVPIVKNLHDRAMPRQEKVKVIVTTRDRSVNKRFVPIPLVEMPLEKAIELLTEIVGEVRIAKEPDTVSDICNKTLGCLPLALELVGEYLNDNPHFTFAKIQKKLALADQVLSQDRSQQKDYGHRGIAAALQLSWEDMSESSRNLAMLLSLFDWTNIDWSLLESVADSTELTEIDPGQLTRLHFLRPLNDDYTAYTIHTLVQAFCQDKLTEQPALNTAYRRVFVDRLLSIAKTISPKPTLAQIEFVAPTIPHLKRLSQEFLEDIANPEENLILAFVGIARFYQGQGFYTLAEDPYKKCLFIHESKLGKDHSHTTSSRNNLGQLYQSMGRYPEALSLFDQSLKIMETKLGVNHSSLIPSLNYLGVLYRQMGEYKKALPMLTRALKICKTELETNNPQMAVILNNLAVLFIGMGDYKDALSLFHEYREVTEKASGANILDITITWNNLATVCFKMRQYDDALSLCEQALAIRKKELGDDHLDVATSSSKLAEMYQKIGSNKEALCLHKIALEIRQKKLEPNHPHIAISLGNLAGVTENCQDALVLYQQALAIDKQHNNQHKIATDLYNLGVLYQEMEDYENALDYLKQSLEICETVLAINHHDTVETRLQYKFVQVQNLLKCDKQTLVYIIQNRFLPPVSELVLDTILSQPSIQSTLKQFLPRRAIP